MEKKEPTVSVILPTYNREWILREAVDSVLAQDYPDFELIVVNDGSTDDTRSALAEYGDRIVVLEQENRGVSAARNLGISSSSGRLISFLDSDDYWLPGKLSAQVAFFNDHRDAQLCQTEEIWVRNGRRVNPKRKHKKRSGMIFEPSLALCLVSPSAVMIRRELFEEVGLFDETLPACEDYDLWLRVSRKHPVHLIDESLIVKRGGHADQLSNAPSLDKHRITSLCKILESAVLSEEQRRAAVKMLDKKCAIYANGCMKRGRVEEASHYNALPAKFTNPPSRLTRATE